MNIKKHIPNFITLLNLFCGCVAVVYIAKDDFETPFYFVCLGIFLDFFDGFFARLFKVSSPLGLQLDSLADMVTSGVAPGFLMYKIFVVEFGSSSFLPYIGFIITLGACYRLANFNIDERQSDSFIGLPTPANALFFMSIPLWIIDFYVIFSDVDDQFVTGAIVFLCFFSAYIMNAEIPLFSLKIKSYVFNKNKLQFLFLGTSLLFLLLCKFAAVPIIIIIYILLSVFYNFFCNKKIGS